MHVPRDRRLEDWIRELVKDKKLYLFYKSPEWLALRGEVMRDHHNECERCAERGKLTREKRGVCVHYIAKQKLGSYAKNFSFHPGKTPIQFAVFRRFL